MKEKIIFGIAYLFHKRTVIYCFILLFWLYMIISSITSYLITKQLTIKNLDENKTKLIQIKEKELKPLEDKAKKLTQEFNTVKLEIIPIEWCINKLKKSLWTTEDISCEPNSFIPKVGAEEKPQEKTTFNERDKILMERVCKYGKLNWKVSPLCNNWQMFNSLKGISEAHWIWFWIALGITYAESHIWVNYAWWCDVSYNNWWGVKWRIGINWNAIKDQKIPDKNWCWVYKFWSIEDYWQSKMKTLQKYKSCFERKDTIKCISYTYIGDPKVAEQSWINRVALISY